MTPQEIESTKKFILEQRAQAAVHLHQAAVDFQRLAERDGKMQSMRELLAELIAVESQRLSRHDETFKAMEALHREALSRLDQNSGEADAGSMNGLAQG